MDGVQLRSLTVAYTVLFAGFLMSLVILVVERCVRRFKIHRTESAITPAVQMHQNAVPMLPKMPIQAWGDGGSTRVANHNGFSTKRWKLLISTRNFTNKVRAVSWRKAKAMFISTSFDETDDSMDYPITIAVESREKFVNAAPSNR